MEKRRKRDAGSKRSGEREKSARKRKDEGGEAIKENREVYERRRDHMVPPGLHDPSRLSHLMQHIHTH